MLLTKYLNLYGRILSLKQMAIEADGNRILQRIPAEMYWSGPIKG